MGFEHSTSRPHVDTQLIKKNSASSTQYNVSKMLVIFVRGELGNLLILYYFFFLLLKK